MGSWVGGFIHPYMCGCADVGVSRWGGERGLGGCTESYMCAGAWGHSLLTLRIIIRTDKTMTARNSIFVRVLISRSTVPILNMKNKQSFCQVLISYTLILTSNALNNDNFSVPKKHTKTLLVFFHQCFNFLIYLIWNTKNSDTISVNFISVDNSQSQCSSEDKNVEQ